MVGSSPQKDAMNAMSRELGGHHTQLAILRAPLQLLSGRECGRAYQQPQCKVILIVVRQSMSDFIQAIKDWPTATTPHKKSHDKKEKSSPGG